MRQAHKQGAYNRQFDNKTFLGEQSNLAEFINMLSTKIQALRANKPFPDVHPYSTAWDREEYEALTYKKHRNAAHEKEIETLSEYLDTPYFARMDFNVRNRTDQYERVYIGKKGLVQDGRQLVVDWRTPVGQRYYLKSETEFKHDAYTYTLLLRRALDISKGKLVTYNDEYVFGQGVFKGGITDPFLVNVLLEKKGEQRLTDIIRTIQENQNNIIRLPAEMSFVVQGCAGSGKTMIMLHRLSYMVFNNPKTDFSRIKIITPNDNFNLHINDLYKELELDRIERYKVDDYYLNLLRLYALERWNRVPVVHADSTMDRQFIKEVYGEEFYSSCHSRYSTYMKTIYDQLAIDIVNEICAAHSLSKPYILARNDRDTVSSYVGFLTRALAENEKNMKALEGVESQMQKRHAELTAFETDPNFHTFMELSTEEKNRLSGELRRLEAASEQCQSACSIVCGKYEIEAVVATEAGLLESYKSVLRQVELKETSAATWEEKLADAQAELEDYLQTNAETIAWNNGQKRDDERALQDVEAKISQIPFWRFAARRELRANALDLRKQLAAKEALYREVSANIEQLRIRINKSALELQNALAKRVAVEDKEIILKCLNTETEIQDKQFELRQQLNRLAEIVDRQLQRLDALKREFAELEARADNLREKTLSEYEKELLREKLSLARKTDFEAVYLNAIKAGLVKLYKAHNLPEPSATYRYHLFLELLCHSMFTGRLSNNDRLLNIDEGQDLAITEYLLLKAIHGEDLVLNIYGDTNQTTSAKGIIDWGEVKGIDRSFMLNENYRNTEQITEFCNSELGFSFTSIGVPGPKVNIITLAEMSEEIDRLLAKKHAGRRAIIVTDYIPVTTARWGALGIRQGALDEGNVSLLSVEDAKGLEFKQVFVLDEEMSRNERYIAYTRALETLTVARSGYKGEVLSGRN